MRRSNVLVRAAVGAALIGLLSGVGLAGAGATPVDPSELTALVEGAEPTEIEDSETATESEPAPETEATDLTAEDAVLDVERDGELVPLAEADDTTGADDAETVGAELADAMVPANAGVTVPGGRNQVAADVLGRGYEQVIRLNGSKVEIVEPATRSGDVIQSFEAGTYSKWPRDAYGIAVFYGGTQLAEIAKHEASQLAVLGSSIFVSVLDQHARTSQVRKYDTKGKLQTTRDFPTDYAVTALDTVRHRDKNLLAIGLNKDGVRIAHADRGGLPDFREVYSNWNNNDCPACYARNMVTAVSLYTADDGRHRLMLAAGRLTYATEAIVGTDLDFQRDPDGNVLKAGIEMWRNNKRPGGIVGPWEWPDILETGPLGASNRQQVGISWPTSNRVTFVDAIHGADHTSTDAEAATAIRFFPAADGEPRVAIRRGASSTVGGVSASGRFYPVIDRLTETDLPYAVPGYRARSITYQNRTASGARVTAFTGTTRETGCFYGTDMSGVQHALPSQITVPAGTTAGPFGAGHRLSGGECGGDNRGVFYLQIDPAGSTAGRQIVQLHSDWRGVQLADQVGGGAVRVTTETHGLYGLRVIISDRHGAPTVQSAPSLRVSRLTPAPPAGWKPKDANERDHVESPIRPVFRFEATGAIWKVPGADADLANTVLTVPTVEGSPDGLEWSVLGTTTSPLAPQRTGDVVTLGESMFDWQTAPHATDHRYFRLTLPGGHVSNVVDTLDPVAVPAPAPAPVAPNDPKRLTGIGLSTPTAPLRPTGLDQLHLRVRILGVESVRFSPDEYPELYNRVYYRDAGTDELITGLGNPDDPRQLIMLSRKPGQYTDENAGTALDSLYLSTNTTMQGRGLKAVIKTTRDSTANWSSAELTVRPDVRSLCTEGWAGSGISIGRCGQNSDPMVLTGPTSARPQPALHSLNESTIALQLRTVAVPGAASLPLSKQDVAADQLSLRSDPLEIEPTKAKLTDPNKFDLPRQTVTTHLATRGQLIIAENIDVKGK